MACCRTGLAVLPAGGVCADTDGLPLPSAIDAEPGAQPASCAGFVPVVLPEFPLFPEPGPCRVGGGADAGPRGSRLARRRVDAPSGRFPAPGRGSRAIDRCVVSGSPAFGLAGSGPGVNAIRPADGRRSLLGEPRRRM